jgi:cell division protein FtsQ
VKPRRVLVAAGAALALGGGAFGVWNSSWLKLEAVQVTGNHHATTQQVQAAAALSPGMRLMAVSGAAVSARVSALPWVADATVTHVLPSRIRISVRERTPVALVQAAAGARTYLVDHAGVVLQDGGAGYPLIAGLPLTVSYPGDRLSLPAFGAAVGLLDAFPPELKARLAWVNAPSPDLLSVILTDHTTVVYGTPDGLGEKNYDVMALLATGKPYASIDVRSPTHPAASPR